MTGPAAGNVRTARWLRSALLLAGAGLSLLSIAIIARSYTPVLYWDQWEMAKRAAIDERSLASLSYLLEHHNEHIIATSKLLFLIDYWVFGYTGHCSVVRPFRCCALRE